MKNLLLEETKQNDRMEGQQRLLRKLFRTVESSKAEVGDAMFLTSKYIMQYCTEHGPETKGRARYLKNPFEGRTRLNQLTLLYSVMSDCKRIEQSFRYSEAFARLIRDAKAARLSEDDSHISEAFDRIVKIFRQADKHNRTNEPRRRL